MKELIGPDTKVVIELGSWLGKSTRFILRQAPGAVVLAVDTWLGGPDHQGPTGACNEKLPTLYETFLVNCWDHQDRLIPLRMPTLVGLEFIHFRGYEPDFIYVDADHSYEAVKADLHKAISLFPGATIMGDDWNWGGESLPVQTAVRETAETHGFTVDVRGNWAWTFR